MRQNDSDTDTSISSLSNMVWQFLEERGWHTTTSRSTATSIVLEASELLEHYQWSDEAVGTKQEVSEELADIMIYCLDFARKNDIDITKEVITKLAKSAKKYPANRFKDKDESSNHKSWIKAKKSYNKKGL